MKMANTKYDILSGTPAAAESMGNHTVSIPAGLNHGDASLIRMRKEVLWLDSPVFGEGDEEGNFKSQSIKEQEK